MVCKLLRCVCAEPLPLCAARVDSLRSHGHREAALRLAVSVVRTMKQQQLVAQRRWHENQQQATGSGTNRGNGSASSGANNQQSSAPCTSRCTGQGGSCSTTSASAPANTDGWVGHPLDPVGTLFDTLSDASVVPENQRPRTPSYLGE